MDRERDPVTGSGGSAELRSHVTDGLRELSALAGEVADSLSEPIGQLATLALETLAADGTLIFCGNGGSAADAQHLAAEYVVRFGRARRALPALALTTDTSVLTAGANDLGFDRVFARQIEALARPGDLLILHSTSGASANLLEATAAARAAGVRTAALLARDGGPLRDRVDLAIIVPTDSTARAQELHLAIGHLVAAWIDRRWDGSTTAAADEGTG